MVWRHTGRQFKEDQTTHGDGCLGHAVRLWQLNLFYHDLGHAVKNPGETPAGRRMEPCAGEAKPPCPRSRPRPRSDVTHTVI